MTVQGLTLRAAAPEDAKSLLAIYAPYVINTAVSFEYEVPDVYEFIRRIKNTLTMYPYIVAVAGERIAGYAYASRFKEREAYSWSVETSVYVDQAVKGRGIGRQLYAKLEEILKYQGVLNMNACIAYPAAKDEHLTDGSFRFHQRMGFKLTGRFSQCACKFGTWYDMVWMEKLIGEHNKQPQSVMPFSQVRQSLDLQ